MRRAHQVAAAAFVVLCIGMHGVAELPPGSRAAAYLVLDLLATVAMLVAWRSTEPQRPGWLLACGVLARLALVTVPTFTTVDVTRYLWDGKLALLGYDPYRTAPLAPGLTALRAEWLPRGVHLELATIYPPVAVGLFALAALGGDPGTAWLLWKMLVTAASLGTLWLAWRLLAAARAQRHLALVALSPLLVLESGVGAHVDTFAALAVTAGLLYVVRGSPDGAGAFLGVGAAVKILPGAALVPLAARRADGVRLAIAGGAVVLAIYAASVAIGLVPIGSIAVPFRAWSFGSPVWTVLEGSLGRAAASLMGLCGVAAMLGVSVWLARRGRWIAGVQLALAAPLVFGPVVFPWYLTSLVPLVALAPRAALVAWICLVPLTYEVLVGAELRGVWEPALWPLVATAAGVALAAVTSWWRADPDARAVTSHRSRRISRHGSPLRQAVREGPVSSRAEQPAAVEAPPQGEIPLRQESLGPLRDLLHALEDASTTRECLESSRRLELLAAVRSSLDGMERELQREHFACCVVPHVQPVEALAASLRRLAARRVGALIAVEQGDSLDDYVARGTLVDARLTPDLLDSLFHPGSRLHDGAVIVRGDRIVSAGVFFPVTGERREPDHGRLLGSRHRAALGLSRLTDALVFVVSEETGQISLALHGLLQRLADPVGSLEAPPGRPAPSGWRARLRRWLEPRGV